MSYLNDKLWINIDSFKLDDEKSVVKFSDKLAKENNWTYAFALRAISEYKRFVYLCCISPTGASPSDLVDTVWHLHLTYTMNYWKDFCPNVLGKELHHFPSKGGIAEKEKHKNWYKETIELYIQTFGEVPPTDIWNLNESTILKSKINKNQAADYIQNSFAIPSYLWIDLAAISLPFLYLTLTQHKFNPYKLTGEYFLEFYLLLGMSLFALAIYRSIQFRKNYSEQIKDQIPKDLTVFELAYLKNGQQNLVQTAIIDLIENNAVFHEGKGVFKISSANSFNTSKKYNPISNNMVDYEKGHLLEYKDFVNASTNASIEIDLKLQSIENKISMDNNIQYLFYTLGIVGAARIAQGIYNDKPVGYLIALLFVFAFVAYFIYKYGNKDFIFKEITEDMYRVSHRDEVTIMYSSAFLDRFIWSGYACMIGDQTYNDLHYFFERKRTKQDSSCSSGGCGSSCSSGGGDGCGSGCGGCGGGD